jgi:hypothetical protein
MTDYKSETPDKLNEAWTAVHDAVKQFNAGLTIDARCPFCENLLLVDGLPIDSPTQWFIRCVCGKCNTTLKGL